eukprot:Phypoly_transcript_07289.p1 GENE.Phypoly_transcript_07289~~Phypoly_transcript_07289.p1  ORF type:complete len:493 (-),score=61.15 Phypoly_transcript_07289:25-1503(-)
MKPHWLEVLEWIQLALTLSFLVVMAGILGLVLRYHRLEFNGLWKTRAFMVAVAIMWALSLLLGRQQLWSPDGGILSTDSSKFEGLCRAHVFLTFGIWQPLFFLTILMILRSKEKSKMDLYADDPNKFIIYNALLWCIPIFLVHIVIIAVGAVHESNPIVWATYSSKNHHCVMPILSTTAFAAFYCFFIIFYVLSSRKLFKRLMNHNLRNRIRWTQLFFVFIFPFEIVVRFILIFISKYQKPYESLYHTYFFMDLIVCSVAVSELVLLPVLDAASYPLLSGVTAQACKEYAKSEEVKKQRRSTRNQQSLSPVLSRGMSAPVFDVDAKHPLIADGAVEMQDFDIKQDFKSISTFGITEDPPTKQPTPSIKRSPSEKGTPGIRTPSEKTIKADKSIKRTPSDIKTDKNVKRTPSNRTLASTPILDPSLDQEEEIQEEEKNMSLHVKIPPVASYPANLEDIFANMDEAGEDLGDSSLKLRVDGVFMDDYPSSSSQR